MSIVLQSSGGGSVTLQEAVTASNLTITVPAVSATMATLTTPSFATTIGVGGATPAASGAGITFPATQSASTDANTLDDYEEGTWTPSYNLLGTLTQTNSGWYRKVGGVVTVGFRTVVTSTNTTQDGSQMIISGLPFQVSGDDIVSCAFLTERVFSGAGTITIHGVASNGSTTLGLILSNYNSGITNATYYSGLLRNTYKGGNMIISGQLSYIAS